MDILKTPDAVRAYTLDQRRLGKQVGFVPTMGALHDGHVKLGQVAQATCQTVIYSIFVNPKQFAPHEDFAKYPRTIDADIAKLKDAGMAAVYLPDTEAMYPKDFLTTVHVDGISKPLEGEFRPHFFDGVATVVAKLLLQVLPDQAFFGEKDYQQLQVVKRMTHDLNLPLEIIGVPTVRDERGLALSSRNAYLSAKQYEIACVLNLVLKRMGQAVKAGTALTDIEAQAHEELLRAGFDKIDYCTVRHAHTLAPQPDFQRDPLRVLVAAWLGSTRLIDNMAV